MPEENVKVLGENPEVKTLSLAITKDAPEVKTPGITFIKKTPKLGEAEASATTIKEEATKAQGETCGKQTCKP